MVEYVYIYIYIYIFLLWLWSGRFSHVLRYYRIATTQGQWNRTQEYLQRGYVSRQRLMAQTKTSIPKPCHLTHWGRDKMAAVSRTTLSNAFSWMKLYEFRLRFHWNLFLGFQLTALVQIMAWRRSGDKPLSETMMVSLTTHICVTRPQWVNKDYVSNINIGKSITMAAYWSSKWSHKTKILFGFYLKFTLLL